MTGAIVLFRQTGFEPGTIGTQPKQEIGQIVPVQTIDKQIVTRRLHIKGIAQGGNLSPSIGQGRIVPKAKDLTGANARGGDIKLSLSHRVESWIIAVK